MNDILYKILTYYLEIDYDIGKIKMFNNVCKLWNNLFNDKDVWKLLYYKFYDNNKNIDYKSIIKKNYLETVNLSFKNKIYWGIENFQNKYVKHLLNYHKDSILITENDLPYLYTATLFGNINIIELLIKKFGIQLEFLDSQE